MLDGDSVCSELAKINRQLCRSLWRLAKYDDTPDESSPRLIFPKLRKGQARVSEQEARFQCASLLKVLDLASPIC